MRAHAMLVAFVLSVTATAAHAESITHYLGRVIGDFGAGVGQGATQPELRSFLVYERLKEAAPTC